MIILLKIYFPFIKREVNRILNNIPGKQFINKPIYLNTKKSIGFYENIHNKKDDTKFKYNYAVSCWIYINPQPPNTNSSYGQYTSLFNFSGKPNILYKGSTNTLLINMQQEGGIIEIYKTNNFPLQKWNNIIINYSGGTLDVFINGVLVISKKNVVPYMAIDNITVGQEQGIEGSICNVRYFSKNLDFNDIIKLYHFTKNNNPPIL